MAVPNILMALAVVLGLSAGSAGPSLAAGPVATVTAKAPADLRVPLPPGRGSGAPVLTLTLAPTQVDRDEAFVVAVYRADDAADAQPLAVFSFFPPPRVGKTADFVAPAPAEAVAAAGADGALRLRIALLPAAKDGRLERSALDVLSARLGWE
ncbi:hypothetical protein [Azospirillum agricola]|uniref:hypothetical protein n=1 Tax=Azospirillum agricola TaxID=1720247 RepID=UPI000A0F0350|nr:hypothetical protein [Azospirillum agricola]SMH37022.1 hypothetical protein SAMN02982994_1127 [Azospirillum lipoferum]